VPDPVPRVRHPAPVALLVPGPVVGREGISRVATKQGWPGSLRCTRPARPCPLTPRRGERHLQRPAPGANRVTLGTHRAGLSEPTGRSHAAPCAPVSTAERRGDVAPSWHAPARCLLIRSASGEGSRPASRGPSALSRAGRCTCDRVTGGRHAEDQAEKQRSDRPGDPAGCRSACAAGAAPQPEERMSEVGGDPSTTPPGEPSGSTPSEPLTGSRQATDVGAGTGLQRCPCQPGRKNASPTDKSKGTTRRALRSCAGPGLRRERCAPGWQSTPRRRPASSPRWQTASA